MSGRLPRSVWARLSVDGIFEVPTSVSRFSYDGSADDVDARHLYWRGLAGNEGETLSVFQEAVIGASVVVDVGANRGLYTLTALADNPTAHVVSVEASPRTFEHLTSMIRLNGWEDRVTAVNAAAGAESGTLPFWVPRSLYASSARLLAASHRSAAVGDVIDVPVVPLDELTETADVVKIDVEGAEHLVLAGMSRLLATSRPLVFIEVLPEAEIHECESILRGAGYSFFHLTDSGAQPRPGLVADPDRRFRNYLCRPGEPRATGSPRR